MSDAPPVSWNPPPGAEPIQQGPDTANIGGVLVGRDGQPIVGRNGEPLSMRDALAQLPQPDEVRPVSYVYAPRSYADPRVDAVLCRLDALHNLVDGKLIALGRVLEQALTQAVPDLSSLENRIMATYAELKTEVDALKANVERVASHAAEQSAKLDELVAIKDNGTEEEFASAIAELKGANERMAAIGANPTAPAPVEPAPVPVPEPTPAPIDETPVEPAPVPTEPVAETPAEPSLPAPDAPPADPTAPVEPGSPANPAT